MAPWEGKLSSFGWRVEVVDGHDHEPLVTSLTRRHPDGPNAVVADVGREGV
jgi:transketolase N-terminal domain/subunit